MECEVCGKRGRRKANVFVQAGALRLCDECVLRLRTQRLDYSEQAQKYRFNGDARKKDRVRGRRLRDHRVLNT